VSIIESEVAKLREWRHELPTTLTILQNQISDSKSEIMDVLLPLRATVEARMDGRQHLMAIVAVLISACSAALMAWSVFHR